MPCFVVCELCYLLWIWYCNILCFFCQTCTQPTNWQRLVFMMMDTILNVLQDSIPELFQHENYCFRCSVEKCSMVCTNEYYPASYDRYRQKGSGTKQRRTTLKK
jgi:hypothetical protein